MKKKGKEKKEKGMGEKSKRKERHQGSTPTANRSPAHEQDSRRTDDHNRSVSAINKSRLGHRAYQPGH